MRFFCQHQEENRESSNFMNIAWWWMLSDIPFILLHSSQIFRKHNMRRNRTWEWTRTCFCAHILKVGTIEALCSTHKSNHPSGSTEQLNYDTKSGLQTADYVPQQALQLTRNQSLHVWLFLQHECWGSHCGTAHLAMESQFSGPDNQGTAMHDLTHLANWWP